MATTTHVSRRSLLTATAATLAGTAVAAAPLALAKGVESDPIFALIDAHRAARQAHGAACEAQPWDEAAAHEACDAEWDAWADLLACDATTVAGAAAFACYALRHAEAMGGEWGMNEETAAQALEAVARMFARLMPSAAA